MPVKIRMPLSVRVKRAAEAVTNGDAILQEVTRNSKAIIEAAAEGDAPVSAVSASLKRKFPSEMEVASTKQFVGLAVKSVLMKEGFELFQSGVRIKGDPVFTTGSLYRRKEELEDKSARAIRKAYAHMVQGMTMAERKLMLDVLQTAMGEDDHG